MADAKFYRMIDHAVLRPEAAREEILENAEGAMNYKVRCYYTGNYFLPLVRDYYAERGYMHTHPCTVVGFPAGYMTTATKVAEAKEAVALGSGEVDMVMNVAAFNGGEYDTVRDDIKAVVDVVEGRILKVIVESNLWDPANLPKACELIREAGGDFIKICTGFSGEGQVEHIRLIKQAVDAMGGGLKIKASGFINSLERAEAMIEAGAERLGTSWGVEIAQAFEAKYGIEPQSAAAAD